MNKKNIRINLIKWFQKDRARLIKNHKAAIKDPTVQQSIEACILYCNHIIDSFANHKLDHIIKD